MKIIEPSAALINPIGLEEGVRALRVIEKMARISHRTVESQTSDSWRRFLQTVAIDRGDLSVVEHSSATVMFRVDRAICMEIVRHRLFSYTMESTRFVKYGGKQVPELEFVLPFNMRNFDNDAWYRTVEDAEKTYSYLVSTGVRPQEARSILPNALVATLAVTGNFRNWRHFLLMRTTKETHPDMRYVTVPLLATFKREIPVLFDDIEPEARQIDNMRKPR